MKRLILLAPALLCWFALFAGSDTYRVTARTLNVRSAPDKDARVVSAVPQGEILEVEELTGDGWARISWHGSDAYVSAGYIEKTDSEAPGKVAESRAPLWNFRGGYVPEVPRRWLVNAVLLLSVLLRLVVKPIRHGLPEKWWPGALLFVLLCGCEIYSVLMLGGDCIWFCLPGEVGFFWMIVNFFLFGLVILNQLLCYFTLLAAMSDKKVSRRVRWDWGLLSWPVLVIASFVLGSGWTLIILCAFLLFQLGFIVWIIWQFAGAGNLPTGLFALFFYLLGTAAILGLSVLYLPLLLIAGAVVLGLKIISVCTADRVIIVDRY